MTRYKNSFTILFIGYPVDYPIENEDSAESSEFCGICTEGGELLICDGTCKNAFHLECVGLSQAPKSAKWFCTECRKSHKNQKLSSSPPASPPTSFHHNNNNNNQNHSHSSSSSSSFHTPSFSRQKIQNPAAAFLSPLLAGSTRSPVPNLQRTPTTPFSPHHPKTFSGTTPSTQNNTTNNNNQSGWPTLPPNAKRSSTFMGPIMAAPRSYNSEGSLMSSEVLFADWREIRDHQKMLDENAQVQKKLLEENQQGEEEKKKRRKVEQLFIEAGQMVYDERWGCWRPAPQNRTNFLFLVEKVTPEI
jgi:hypothetical protein